MEQWLRRNHTVIPWTILGLELAVSLGLRLYKIKTGIAQDIDVIPSPAKTLLPKLSEEETANLPYPPDAYPGARDVESAYGSLRIYEWGPEDGRKVLLVHGISNPCVALGSIAHGLVDRGCRVMLLDMPGKGYSSTPLPTPHSARLFTTCILLALTSSPISWTGNGATFSLIGYSLGGGICANFTSYFPDLVSSLVLLAPAGLIRGNRLSLLSSFLYNTGLINESMLENIIKNRLLGGDTPTNVKRLPNKNPAAAEASKDDQASILQAPVLSRTRPGITIANTVAWQIGAHQGYVKSFISCVRYGPITGQHSDWQRIGKRLSAQNASSEERYSKRGLQNGRVLILLGKDDLIIHKEELTEDATEALGDHNVHFESFDAGHELPVKRGPEIVDCIWKFWQGE